MNGNTNTRMFVSRQPEFYFSPQLTAGPAGQMLYVRSSPMKHFQVPTQFITAVRQNPPPQFVSEAPKTITTSASKNLSGYRTQVTTNFPPRDLQPMTAPSPYGLPVPIKRPLGVRTNYGHTPAAVRPPSALPPRVNPPPTHQPVVQAPPPIQINNGIQQPHANADQPSQANRPTNEYHGISSEGLHPMVNLTSTTYFNAPGTSGHGSDHSGGPKESVVLTRYKFGDEVPRTPPSNTKPGLTPVALYARAPFTNEFNIDLVTSHENISEAIRHIREANQRHSPERTRLVSESYKDGSRYEGEMVRDQKHGHGKFYYPSGEVYEGEMEYNRREGHGVLWAANGGKRYDGEWRGDLFHGKGTLYNEFPEPLPKDFNCTAPTSLERYAVSMEGDFVEGRFTGRGTVILFDGSRYWGQFHNGVIHGIASHQTCDGNIIVGEWTSNRLTKQF
eukprot:TRINITY_DN6573_c0_g3_i2.p1 TRINITY_DN6573_c0_g3~~TRINITY_DN6573_c0_g3_i2.p1  ORF type:complete len:446 (-),score=75.48 TRINITY_DN6573_c0_g3_i2:49-1386(-)